VRNRLPLALSLIALVASLLALAQRGSAGSQLPPGSTVSIVVSKGEETATVPNAATATPAVFTANDVQLTLAICVPRAATLL